MGFVWPANLGQVAGNISLSPNAVARNTCRMASSEKSVDFSSNRAIGPTSGNLLSDLPAPAPDEHFQPLLKHGSGRVERIVSHGQASEAWYDQKDTEFVVVLKGEGVLEIEGEEKHRTLAEGDWIVLPARCRHRVVGTSAVGPTVWLAVHLAEPDVACKMTE